MRVNVDVLVWVAMDVVLLVSLVLLVVFVFIVGFLGVIVNMVCYLMVLLMVLMLFMVSMINGIMVQMLEIMRNGGSLSCSLKQGKVCVTLVNGRQGSLLLTSWMPVWPFWFAPALAPCMRFQKVI